MSLKFLYCETDDQGVCLWLVHNEHVGPIRVEASKARELRRLAEQMVAVVDAPFVAEPEPSPADSAARSAS